MVQIELQPGFWDTLIVEERSDVASVITTKDQKGSEMYFTGYPDARGKPVFSYHLQHAALFADRNEVRDWVLNVGDFTGMEVFTTRTHYIH